ncbi:hypothetical protein [Pandoraea sputorum]|uniref:Esterase n=1 Tax=Pandoraea sputorum TaxID=93222 RepID=A0A5E5AW13_9BURK|nr:hypothetical protein [Pandoraea sputorum]VVE77749.1 esterase [Pandoraea sputorum]
MTSVALATPAPPHAADACDAHAPQYRLGLVSPRLLALKAALCAGGNTDAFWHEVSATGTPGSLAAACSMPSFGRAADEP